MSVRKRIFSLHNLTDPKAWYTACIQTSGFKPLKFLFKTRTKVVHKNVIQCFNYIRKSESKKKPSKIKT